MRKRYINAPELSAEYVAKNSLVAASLVHWIWAVSDYAKTITALGKKNGFYQEEGNASDKFEFNIKSLSNP